MSPTARKVEALKPLLDRVNRDFCWRVGSEGPRRINEPLTDEKVAAHIEGRERYGVCPMKQGTDTTRLAILDFDDHDGVLPWAEMRSTVDMVVDSLKCDGYHPILFKSTGGKGVHLFILFDEQQNAYSVQQMLRSTLEQCGLKSGTKGVAQQEVEIFPKNRSIAPDGFGSMFVLPGAGKSEPLDPSFEWVTSQDVPHVELPPQPERAVQTPETERVKNALNAIPNEDLSYDEWRNLVFAIHHATEGSDEGLALAHDFSARSSKYDPDFLDNRVWPYINSERGGAVITATTLFLQAAANGWEDPAIADAFDVLVPEDNPAPAPTKQGRFACIPADVFAQGKPATWIIKGVLPRADLAVVYGESGSGKSFFALDLVCSVATGSEWRGKRVKQGRVVYIAAEGAAGFRNRLNAYGEHRDAPLDLLDLSVIPNAPNFMLEADINDVVASVKALGTVDLIVVDTFAQVMPGANENAGEDVGKALGHCRELKRLTGAMVVLIHHSGKDASKGARGWSGLNAASDCTIEIVRAEEDRVATVTKLKDGEDGAEFGFRLQTVPVGTDEDGEIVSSCVVEYTAAVSKERRKMGKPGAVEKAALKAVSDLQGLDGTAPLNSEVIAVAVEILPPDANPNRDTRAQRVSRALKSLVLKGALLEQGDRYALPEND